MLIRNEAVGQDMFTQFVLYFAFRNIEILIPESESTDYSCLLFVCGVFNFTNFKNNTSLKNVSVIFLNQLVHISGDPIVIPFSRVKKHLHCLKGLNVSRVALKVINSKLNVVGFFSLYSTC